MRLFWALAVCQAVVSAAIDDDVDFVWVQAGGGLRTHMGNIGFASVFYQAGILSNESNIFKSVSTFSGSSLFATQLFFSQPYLEKLLTENPQKVAAFTREWLQGALIKQSSTRSYDPRCEVFNTPVLRGADGDALDMFSLCNFFAQQDGGGDWGAFSENQFRITSTNYGDLGFEERIASAENRVHTFSNTDLHVILGLSPTGLDESTNHVIALGPNNREDSSEQGGGTPRINNTESLLAYTHALTAVYSVSSKDEGSPWSYAVEEGEFPFVTQPFEQPLQYNESDWEDFLLVENGNLVTPVTRLDPVPDGSVGIFREPFGGQTATVTQLAGSSTAVFSYLSIRAYATMAMLASTIDLGIDQSSFSEGLANLVRQDYARGLEALTTDASTIFRGTAVCTQWPNPCTFQDGTFIDGGFVDSPGLGTAVGQYQKRYGSQRKLKLIMTLNVAANDPLGQLLSAFPSPATEGSTPGGYIWPVGPGGNLPRSINPFRSTQVFDTYLDRETTLATFTEMPNTNFSTAIFDLTTVDNSAYRIQGGQIVELLVLRTVVDIPIVDEFDPPSAEKVIDVYSGLASSIAGTLELVNRVQDFVGTMDPLDDSTSAAAARNDWTFLFLQCVALVGLFRWMQ